MNSRIFQRGDWICGAIAALVAFVVYAWTTAPSVTLLDSGEFLVAAQHFGVPHPTGYPLWTLLAWLFQLIPLGNVAWQVALFSGICGALCVGLAAMLIRSTALWLAPAVAEKSLASIAAITFSLVFAFSQSMWSQAVIVEVYTLHALLVGLYLTSLYVWLRRPDRMGPLYASVFLLSLAFSNHQLTLALAVLPVIIVLLVRRDLFWDLLLAGTVTALIAYLSFALLADNPLVIKAAIRLAWLVVTILVIALILKRGRLHWKLIAFLPALIALGLLPYLYMPIASGTNPPMNWSYTRTPEGFFYSFNRSQYSGSLSDLSLRVFSKILGVADEKPLFDETPPSIDGKPPSLLRDLQTWSSFFWARTFASFTPLGILFFFAVFIGALRTPRAWVTRRVWIYLLVFAFCLAMVFQPVLEHATTDRAGWWLQMPYHTYTNFIFTLLAGIGAFMVLQAFAARLPRLRPVTWALVLLPIWPLLENDASCSQRGRLFGWQYGRDMVSVMPRGSVIFGGTDAGRFVPTYMIFGESSLPPSRRIDPAFDRSDLYILTQNGLTDRFYLQYIRDQYTDQRPPVRNAFERWLGRETAYPKDPLVLPTFEEMREISKKAVSELKAKQPNADILAVNRAMHNATAQWIFEHNKAKHTFFVEESFPMRWSYPYAIPDGLVYRLNPEPLARLSDDIVRKDFAFWTDYVAKLKADSNFAKDYDAQRNFSRLRLTTGYLYQHRDMNVAAEGAYRQAIDLWIGNLDAIISLSGILWERREFDEPIALFDLARAYDPNNPEMLRYRALAGLRKEKQIEIDRTLETWRKHPQDLVPLRRLLELTMQVGANDQVDALLKESIGKLGDNPDFLALVLEVSEARNDWPSARDAADRWAKARPDSAEAFYRLARAEFMLEKKQEAVNALVKSVDVGGVEYRERLFSDPVFQSLKDVPELARLMVAPPPATK
jgi:tetratricopeptide (TPR) repeat protein